MEPPRFIIIGLDRNASNARGAEVIDDHLMEMMM